MVNNIEVERVIAELEVTVTKSSQAGGNGITSVLRLPVIVDVDPAKQYEIAGCGASLNNEGNSQASGAKKFLVPLSDLEAQIGNLQLDCPSIIGGSRLFFSNSACHRWCVRVKSFVSGFIMECDGTTDPKNHKALCTCVP